MGGLPMAFAAHQLPASAFAKAIRSIASFDAGSLSWLAILRVSSARSCQCSGSSKMDGLMPSLPRAPATLRP
jgi:hypothetical protein